MENMFTVAETIKLMESVGCSIEDYSIDNFHSGLNEEWSDHMEGENSIKEYVSEPKKVIALIVKAHLDEMECYYEELEEMEEEEIKDTGND